MVYLFVTGLMSVFCLNFEIISVVLKCDAEYFQKHKKSGCAEVVGYDTSEGSRWYSLVVKVLDLSDSKTYICNSAKVDIHDYPKGAIVDVLYIVTKHGHTQVYLADCLPADKSGIAKVFNNMSVICGVVALGFILVFL